jgi:hypothetical protein
MTQMSTQPVARVGGGLDVYTGLLLVACLVLAVGVALLAIRNIEHSKVGTQDGGLLTLVPQR